MSNFFCADCKLTFENNQKQKKEYQDYIFGPCWKYIAYCPQCEQECSEKPESKPGKANIEMQMPCGGGSCQGGSCNMFK